MFRRFILEEDGITAIEYSLIGTLVTVSAMTAMDRMGGALETKIYVLMNVIANAV